MTPACMTEGCHQPAFYRFVVADQVYYACEEHMVDEIHDRMDQASKGGPVHAELSRIHPDPYAPCPVTGGEHDWSRESYSADPAAPLFTVCIACGARK